MVEADLAHRLPSAPQLSIEALKAYVTALAWRSVLLRDSKYEQLRAQNAHSAFVLAHDEYKKRLNNVVG